MGLVSFLYFIQSRVPVVDFVLCKSCLWWQCHQAVLSCRSSLGSVCDRSQLCHPGQPPSWSLPFFMTSSTWCLPEVCSSLEPPPSNPGQDPPMGKTCSYPASLQGWSAANSNSTDRLHHLQMVILSFSQQTCLLIKYCITHAATSLSYTGTNGDHTQPWPQRMHVLAKETNTFINKSIWSATKKIEYFKI